MAAARPRLLLAFPPSAARREGLTAQRGLGPRERGGDPGRMD